MLNTIIGLMYAAVIAVLVMYALHLVTLILLYLIHKSEGSPPLPDIGRTNVPAVLVQIPLRNERYVVENILQAVTNLEWPSDKLYIQVLDDSDDDTYELAISAVTKLQEHGYPITLLHRKHNIGYKAGALSVGMTYTDCDYIAIFDADFYPDPKFLQQTMPYLINDPNLAMVQTRWCFENTSFSYVTNCQAMALEGHFVIDHIARNRSKLLMNFNGTAGIWRRRAIEQSGGWQSETLAEDLDLSYRAQLAGWKFLYLPAVTSPSQLPRNVSAFKQQQRRWAKGAAQTLRKLAYPIIRSPHIRIGQKVMALLHLSGYITQLLFVLLIILSLPMTITYPTPPPYVQILGPISVIPLIYYALSQKALYHNGLKRIRYYPLLALLGIACSYDITSALFDGFLHWGGDFIRTPKFNSNNEKHKNGVPVYSELDETPTPKNIIFLLYTIFTIYIALTFGVAHYVIPSIMYITAQLLYHITVRFEATKMWD